MKRPRLILATLVALGAVGVGAYTSLRPRVFRFGALDLKMTREQALDRSRVLLADSGFSLPSDLTGSARFWTYSTPMIYLEKNIGTKETNRWLKADGLPVWGWEARFFKPGEKQEYRAWWSPQGRPIGYQQRLLREAPSKNLTADRALKLAESAARSLFGNDFSGYVLVERSSEDLPHRTDHAFRWKAPKTPLKSRLFVAVGVSGDRVTSVQREIEVPEEFYQRERSVQATRGLLSSAVSRLDSVLLITLCAYLLVFWKRRWVRWRPSVFLAGAVFLVSLLSLLNQLPLRWHEYGTEKTVAAFWSSELLYSVLFLAISAAWIGLQIGSADVMGRLSPGPAYSIGEIVSPGFFSSRNYAVATVAGFGAAGIHLGYVAAFYLFGQRWFGLYTPLDVEYDNLLTTAFPWISALLVGLQPAILEECVYRLFAIPLLARLFKRTAPAVLVSALLWGFLHTGYYVEPIWARGLELTLIGILLGWLYLRFGIWASIVSHFVYNTTIGSSLLLQSDNAYFRFSSLAVIGLLALPFLHSLFRFAARKDLTEFPEKRLKWPPSVPARIPDVDRRHRKEPPLLPIRWPVAFSLVAAAILLLSLPSDSLLRDLLTRREAAAAAEEKLQSLSYTTEGRVVSAELVQDEPSSDVTGYVSRWLSEDEARDFLDRFAPVEPLWTVSFKSKSVPERCAVAMGAAGETRSLYCRSPEDSPGKSLPLRESRRLAESFLIREGVEMSGLKYVTSQEESLPQRTDSLHEWTDRAARLGDLQQYVQVEVAGDRISAFDREFRVPEAFRRARASETVFGVIRKAALIVLASILAFIFLRSLFDRIVLASLRSRLAILASAVTAGTVLVEWANRLPLFWSAYLAGTPPAAYAGRQILLLFGKLLAYGAGSYVVALLFLRLPPQIHAEAPTAADMEVVARRFPWRWRQSRSMFAWALGLSLFGLLLNALFLLLRGEAPDSFLPVSYAALSTGVPAVEFFTESWRSLLQWVAIAVGVSACLKFLPAWARWALLAFFLFSVSVLQQDTWMDVAEVLANFAVTAYVVFRIIRFRLPFFFWYAVLQAALPFVPVLLFGRGAYFFNALAVLGTVAAMLLVGFLPRRAEGAAG